MLSDGTWTYTWEHGRELATMSNGSTTWTNTYNADGLRTSRTNGSTTYSYVYNGSSLSQMTVGNNTLYFAYDASGTPMSITYNGTNYYYATNVQGDVTAILNTSGTAVVQYTYDAWGKILTTTGSMASTLGAHNPLRYRGYVYDTETTLYYLQSRYYNPAMGRFINADNYPSTGQGLLGNNMFAYCKNDPVVMSDINGDTPETIFDIISLGTSILDVAVDPWDPWAWVGLLGDIADVALPCVCGLGEAVDVLKAMNVIDDSVDVAKLTENTLETIKTVAQNDYPGAEYVYKALKKGNSTMLEYVGITNDFARRSGEWSNVRNILPYVDNLSHEGTRYVEQTVISLLGRKGNTLSNIRNSIGRKGALKTGFREFFDSFF